MDIFLQCIECQAIYPLDDRRYLCDCQAQGLLEVGYHKRCFDNISTELFDQRLQSRRAVDRSGVWRFREVICGFRDEEIVTHPEGSTPLLWRKDLADYVGGEHFSVKHEGQNPTGSFKDRGMTCAVTQAKRLGMTRVGCASTGNTSASLASYAGRCQLEAVVFLPQGKVAQGKLAQAQGYGARCLELAGDFDQAMAIVQRLAQEGELYMVNSINPFRLEGQKSVMWEMLQDLCWQEPDWVVVPGGNLGNTSAFGKALIEAKKAGWITKIPRLATIQAQGASPFYKSFVRGFDRLISEPAETMATAIRIGNPVNFAKAKRVIQSTNGVVFAVTDDEIREAKAAIDRSGIGCEPASACSVAGAKKLIEQGVIAKNERIVGILTGHILKDPEATISCAKAPRVTVPVDYGKIKEVIHSGG